MTQEDLQRDVKRLEAMRKSLADSCEAMWQNAGMAASDDDVRDIVALDRVIETARVLASMSDRQRSNIAGHCEAMATAHESPDADDDRGSWADAHRKVARLLGGSQ